MSRVIRTLAAMLAIVTAAPAASAQSHAPSASQGNDAASHFDRGTAFYTDGDYAAALIEFKRAYELSPHWQVLFNVGQSYFQLHDYANALTTLQRFASEGGDRIGKDDRATLDAELPDLLNRVAKLTIVSNVDGASVSVDDQAVGVTPMREAVLVSAGNRVLSATAPGHAPVQKRIAVGGRDVETVHLDFAGRAPAEVAVSPEKATDRSEPTNREGESHGSYAPAYVTLVLAGAGLGVGAVFGVLAMNGKSSLDNECPGGACPASAQHDIDALSRNDTIATIGFGVGAASLAASAVLWLIARPSSPTKTGSNRGPALTPSLQPGLASISGRF